MSWGAETPLYADTFEKQRLGRASSFRAITQQGLFLFMSLFAMQLANTSELYPYLIGIALVLVSFGIALFIIRESPAPSVPSQAEEHYNPIKHIGLLFTSREYVKVASLGAISLMYPASFNLFLPLLATETLGLEKGQYGFAIAVGAGVAMITAIPAGHLVDRLGPKYLLLIVYAAMTFGGVAMIFLVQDLQTLIVFASIQNFTQGLGGVAIMPLIFQHAPDHERGKVFGLIQFVRAAAAFLITPLIGWLSDAFHSYRVGYTVCTALAVAGILIALTVRKPTHTPSAPGGGLD